MRTECKVSDMSDQNRRIHPFRFKETDDIQSGWGIEAICSGGSAEGIYSISKVSSFAVVP